MRRRRSFLFALAILACLICGVLGVLVAMVRHVPNWYANAEISPSTDRTQLAQECDSLGSDLISMIKDEHAWGGKFEARQLNSYIQEGRLEHLFGADFLPANVSDLRIAFEPDRIRFGFRYGKGIWSTILSITFSVWAAQDDCSAIVLEMESFEAGALPVSAQSVLEDVSRSLREKDIEISWYRHNGHPVAVIRLQTNQQQATTQLTNIQVKDGVLVIQGRNNDPNAKQDAPAPSPAPNGSN